MAGEPARKRATYDDVLLAPPNMVAEVTHVEIVPGFALNARIGAAFVRGSSGVLRGTLELMPGWVGGGLITIGLGLEWQAY